MNEFLLLLLFSLLGSVISLIGGVYLLYGGRGAGLLQKISIPFAAGALLAASFFDLLPEAMHDSEPQKILAWTCAGFLLFFVLERVLRWFHHHHQHQEADQANKSLIIVGDTVHNFIDGLAIGAAFLVNPASGMVVALAIAAHEIPQEIGDFGLLLHKGMKRSRVLLVNVLGALATVVAAVLIFAFGQQSVLPIDIILAITAGFFIYIAASDIIPTIHEKESARLANTETAILLASVLLVAITTTTVHGLIEDKTQRPHIESAEHHHE